MAVLYSDHQDLSARYQGVLSSKGDVQAVFEQARQREPYFFELSNDGGQSLLVGVSRDCGCVRRMSSDGDPPYLMATNLSTLDADGHVEFLAGNTPTPVPRRYCLPLEFVQDIVTEFIERGAIVTPVLWEEI